DSALTTGIVATINKEIKSYTIGVNDSKLDESSEAARFASYFKIQQVLNTIDEEDILNSLNQYDDSLAEPLGDFSSLPMLKVCEIAKRELTVVLSGDGGDELFWGYPRFFSAAKYYKYFNKNMVMKF